MFTEHRRYAEGGPTCDLVSDVGGGYMRQLSTYSAAALSTALLAAASGCEDGPGQWPNDEGVPRVGANNVDNSQLAEGVGVASPVLAESVVVQPDSLTIPMGQGGEEALQWPAGMPVVSDRASDNAEGNPFGFMRKVMSVRQEGGMVVVETEQAAFEEVVEGNADISFDLNSVEEVDTGDMDLSRYFPDDTPVGEGVAGGGNGGMLSAGRQVQKLIGATVSGSAAFNLRETWTFFERKETKTYGGVEVEVDGRAAITGIVNFDPTLRFSFDVSGGSIIPPRLPSLEYFEVSASGALTASAGLNVSVAMTPTNRDQAFLDQFESLLETDPWQATQFGAAGLGGGPDFSVLLRRSKPMKGPRIAGVPTTFQLRVYADCKVSASGQVHAAAKLTINSPNMHAGARWEDGRFRLSQNFDTSASADVTVTGGGGVVLDCGVSPRVYWLIADKGGPFIGARVGPYVNSTYDESCDETSPVTARADVNTTVGLGAKASVQVGGEIDAFKVIDIEIGPFDVYTKDFGILRSWDFSFPRSAFRQCLSTCEDGELSPGETSIDCGGTQCFSCPLGANCSDASDCSSEVCSTAGECVVSECYDGRQNNDEVGVDCSGSCPTLCANGDACATDTDCQSNLCSVYDNLCTSSLCEDGVQNNGETCLDGGEVCGVERRCELGQGCLANSDCKSNICNFAASTCAAGHCENGRTDRLESDIDCGGPECAARCALSAGCLESADCESGTCHATLNICVSGPCADGALDPGESDLDCGGVCGANCELDQNCFSNADCASGVCHSAFNTCVASACENGVIDPGETSADCGGDNCAPCALGKACLVDTDCRVGVCTGGSAIKYCAASACVDAVLNNDETDTDCGGSCDPCATGKACLENSDCKSFVCTDGTCISDRCRDRLRNGTETDVDCGGSCATACATGQSCLNGSDCDTGFCNVQTLTCVASACEDGQQNGDEIDLDCGGSCGATCAVGDDCSGGADCASGVCNVLTSVCGADSCDNGIDDPGETDVDCGGSCGAQCGVGAKCLANSDCQSSSCNQETLTCDADQCSNGERDGDETDVDCGGSCADQCATGEVCDTGTDCLSGYCHVSNSICVSDHCSDGERNEGETDVDCGGAECGDCATGAGCDVPADCLSGFCNADTNVCVATHCEDGRANNGETDIDCGSVCAPSYCSFGQGCSQANTLPGLLHPGDVSCGDCGTRACSEAGVCIQRLPSSCIGAFYDELNDGDDVFPVSGAKTIDLDNACGSQPPVSVYCQFPAEAVWTVSPATTGILTLAYYASSRPKPGDAFGTPTGTTDADGLQFDPLVDVGGSAQLDLNTLWWTRMKWMAYVDYGSGFVVAYESEWIDRDDLLLEFGQRGWFLYGNNAGTTPYYWCMGEELGGSGEPYSDQLYPDLGPTPPNPPRNCKGHSQLFGGYDFSNSLSVNQGLTSQLSRTYSVTNTGFLNETADRQLISLPNQGGQSGSQAHVHENNDGVGSTEPGQIHVIWVE